MFRAAFTSRFHVPPPSRPGALLLLLQWRTLWIAPRFRSTIFCSERLYVLDSARMLLSRLHVSWHVTEVLCSQTEWYSTLGRC